MQKTTLYLPKDLEDQIAAAAAASGRPEAEIIREALRSYVPEIIAPTPTIPLFASGDPTLAEWVDDALTGLRRELILLDTRGLLAAIDRASAGIGGRLRHCGRLARRACCRRSCSPSWTTWSGAG